MISQSSALQCPLLHLLLWPSNSSLTANHNQIYRFSGFYHASKQQEWLFLFQDTVLKCFIEALEQNRFRYTCVLCTYITTPIQIEVYESCSSALFSMCRQYHRHLHQHQIVPGTRGTLKLNNIWINVFFFFHGYLKSVDHLLLFQLVSLFTLFKKPLHQQK